MDDWHGRVVHTEHGNRYIRQQPYADILIGRSDTGKRRLRTVGGCGYVRTSYIAEHARPAIARGRRCEVCNVWAIRLPLTYLLCYVWNMGAVGVFWANTLSLLFRMVCNMARFIKGKYLYMRV